jgi:hypothetical protein
MSSILKWPRLFASTNGDDPSRVGKGANKGGPSLFEAGVILGVLLCGELALEGPDLSMGLKLSVPRGEDPGLGYSQGRTRFLQPEQIGFSSLH